MNIFHLKRMKKRREAALSSLFNASASVYVREKKFDSELCRHVFRETLLYSKIPCRISYKKSYLFSSRRETDKLSPLNETVRLFLPAGYDIPPGSRINVAKDGVWYDFSVLSPADVYSVHQEVDVELFKEWK